MFLFMDVYGIRVHIHFDPVLLPIYSSENVSIIFYCASIWYWKEVKIKETERENSSVSNIEHTLEQH